MHCDFIVSEAFQSKGLKSHLADCDFSLRSVTLEVSLFKVIRV